MPDPMKALQADCDFLAECFGDALDCIIDTWPESRLRLYVERIQLIRERLVKERHGCLADCIVCVLLAELGKRVLKPLKAHAAAEAGLTPADHLGQQ